MNEPETFIPITKKELRCLQQKVADQRKLIEQLVKACKTALWCFGKKDTPDIMIVLPKHYDEIEAALEAARKQKG